MIAAFQNISQKAVLHALPGDVPTKCSDRNLRSLAFGFRIGGLNFVGAFRILRSGLTEQEGLEQMR